VIYTELTPQVAILLGMSPEWAHLAVDDETLADVGTASHTAAASIVDIPYQLLRTSRAVDVVKRSVLVCLPILGCKTVTTWDEVVVRAGGGDLNDVAVTLTSGGGPPGGPFAAQTPFIGVTPGAGRRVPEAALPLWQQSGRRAR
jgi:hypothetical protein